MKIDKLNEIFSLIYRKNAINKRIVLPIQEKGI